MTAAARRRRLVPVAVLAALDVALSACLIFARPSRISYGLPGLPAIDGAQVDELVIARPTDTLSLERSADGWTIAPGEYPADPGIAADMVAAVANFRLTDMVSTSGDPARYELGIDRRVAVSLLGGGKTLRTVYLGKLASTQNHTYAALPGDDRVFQAAGALRFLFEQDVAQYRARK